MSVMMNAIIDLPMISPPRCPGFCAIQGRIKDVTFGATLICAYFVLWFRIYIVFYQNKLMKQDINKFVQIVNISAMPLLLVTVIAIIVRYLKQPGFVYAGCGCRATHTRNDFIINWVALVVCTAVFQIVFLFCFVYPLYLHRKKMQSCGCNQPSIIQIVKRAAIAAGVCITSDLLNLLFALGYRDPNKSISHPLQTYLSYMIFTINLLVNLSATILSFANWRNKVFPIGKEFDNESVRQTTQPEVVE